MAEEVKQKPKFPLGVLTLGLLNCFLGLSTLINAFAANQNDFQTFQSFLVESGITVPVTYSQFKAAIIISALVFSVFLIGGVGILLRREWGRKTTVYSALGVAAILLLSGIIQPSLIGFAILQAVYPGILIFYFTNKNVENFFNSNDSPDGLSESVKKS